MGFPPVADRALFRGRLAFEHAFSSIKGGPIGVIGNAGCKSCIAGFVNDEALIFQEGRTESHAVVSG